MDWSQVIEKMKGYFESVAGIHHEMVSYWQEQVLLSWRWWLKLAMLILPWVFWFFVRKKDSTRRLLLAGFATMAISVYLDTTFSNAGLWVTIGRLIPYDDNTAYDLSMLPVATMLLIQWFPKIKPVWKALIFALLGAFIGLPLLAWMGLYRNVQWSYWYSVPILFLTYLFASWLATGRTYEPVHEPTEGGAK